MGINDKEMLITSGVLIILFLLFLPSLSYQSILNDESFFELSVLGENFLAEGYYPNGNDTIEINQKVEWNILITNHMGEYKHVNVKIKLLNSTNMLPNSTLKLPSDVKPIYDLHFGLDDDESTVFPIVWELKEINLNYSLIEIKSIIINDDEIKVTTYDSLENNFSILFELWIYNDQSNQMEFGWIAEAGKRIIWTQMHFSVARVQS